MATVAMTISKQALWTGRVLSALPLLFLLFDGVIKVIKIQPVIDSMATLGYPDIARGLGVLELVCTILYAIPRTALLGAILLTGLLGGAIATHLRVQDPWLTHTLFSLYLAAPLWLGLWMRDPQLRELLPLRRRV
jgi:DoxX-like protein